MATMQVGNIDMVASCTNEITSGDPAGTQRSRINEIVVKRVKTPGESAVTCAVLRDHEHVDRAAVGVAPLVPDHAREVDRVARLKQVAGGPRDLDLDPPGDDVEHLLAGVLEVVAELG